MSIKGNIPKKEVVNLCNNRIRSARMHLKRCFQCSESAYYAEIEALEYIRDKIKQYEVKS